MKKKFSGSIFIISFCLLANLAAAKSIIISPDHSIVNQSKRTYYSVTFLPVKQGTLPDNMGKNWKIKVPDSNGTNGFANPVCFALSFSGFGSFPTPIYFTNIGQSNMAAYVDANFNYDYTDDGNPFHADEKGNIYVRIPSPRDKKIIVTCLYKIIPESERTERSEWLLSSFERSNKGKKHLEDKFWMLCIPDIIKAQNVLIDQDSTCVALFDMDCDGCYSIGNDKIAMLPVGTDSANGRKGYGAYLLEDQLIIGFKGKAYEVITENGDLVSIKLKPRPDLAAPITLLIGQVIPEIKVTLLTGQSVNFSSLTVPGKATYINFWSTDTTYIGKSNQNVNSLFNSKSDSITIISFNLDKDNSVAREYVSKNKMNWTQCISDINLEKMLYRDSQIPYGILIDSSGKIAGFDIDSDTAQYYLPFLYNKGK